MEQECSRIGDHLWSTDAAYMGTQRHGVSVVWSRDRPIYRQIADRLREQIREGEFAPGAKLPSESELVDAYATSRLTIRRALGVLSTEEGLVERRKGVGVFVRKNPPMVRQARVRFDRDIRGADKGALAAEAEAQGHTTQQQVLRLAEVTPSPEVSEVLSVPPDGTVFLRRRRISIDGHPAQMADSYYPMDIATLADGIRQPDAGPGGTYARIEEQGYAFSRFVERLTVGMPTPEEAADLRLVEGDAVVRLRRVAYARHGDDPERAVECFFAVMVAWAQEFEYEVPAV